MQLKDTSNPVQVMPRNCLNPYVNVVQNRFREKNLRLISTLRDLTFIVNATQTCEKKKNLAFPGLYCCKLHIQIWIEKYWKENAVNNHIISNHSRVNEINCTFPFTIFVVEKNWNENMVDSAASQFVLLVSRGSACPPAARNSLIDYNKIICVKAQTSSPLCPLTFFTFQSQLFTI